MEELLPYLPYLLGSVLTPCVIVIFRFLTVVVLSRRPDIKSIQPGLHGYSFQRFDAPPKALPKLAKVCLSDTKKIPAKSKKKPPKKRSRAPA
jgi:hypothetical protein